jgi:phytoene dehydrogenase-like protein
MAAGTAHVVGAGLAGLAASIALADAGWRVALYEAAPAAGGRCRSFDDPRLGCRIDNGNHLVLSGNRATRAYLRRIGSQNALVGPARARLDLIDLADGRRSVLDLLKPDPGRAVDLLRLLCAGPGDTVADRLGASPRFRAIWAPLALAALNTAPQEGSARLFRRVLLETLAFGARPLVARDGLSAAFIDPALAHLQIGRAHV